MRRSKKYFFGFVLVLLAAITHGQSFEINGNVAVAGKGKLLQGVDVMIGETQQMTKSNAAGRFHFEVEEAGEYTVLLFAEGYQTVTEVVTVGDGRDGDITVKMERLIIDLRAVEVAAEGAGGYSLRHLRNVEGTAIYAAKKSEVIELDNIVANLAVNNPRQVYKGIAGLNIWENDGAGLQLAIGARGLDPNRTSNFNTRQNGYDISADALGYPESYYTPPTQALQRIEIVRGAASLQYGPQFGGLLNFVFKRGNPDKPFEFLTENTVGSFGMLSSFNSIGGTKGDWNYYGFYQRKQGEGWRPNSDFNQNTAYLSVRRQIGDRLEIGLEHTHMDYLAHQPGGLQDFEFEQDARQSNRTRNWFAVDWNLSALQLDYRISDKTRINSRSFFLDAQRQALGELGPINRPDPMRERDLIRGTYQNFGSEMRLIHRYELGRQLTTFLVGGRYYQGFTTNKQGDASNGSDADFNFINNDDLERSDYEFPSRNLSLFAENLFNLTDRFSVTPGVRFEHIRTASDGYFKERVYSGGKLIFEQRFDEEKENSRSFVLMGLGLGYKAGESVELYANYSENYRSINFSDLAVVNANLVIDSLLEDETGYNTDIGIRGDLLDGALQFDASLFYLRYRNRIGIGTHPDPENDAAFRTNIGDARIVGMEAYTEVDVLKLAGRNDTVYGLSFFANFSLLQGEYLSGMSSFKGNEVELIPPFSLKSGINARWKKFRLAYQIAYSGSHYSDATNAKFVVNATRGIIPAYSVQDLSVSYALRRFRFQVSVNNLADARYFTRRATAYPGPGIIPADGRSVFGTVSFRW